MGNKMRSIHIINSTYEDVISNLSSCQMHNRVSGNMDSINNIKRSNIIKYFSSLKPTIATFYLTNNNNNISVVSDYLDNSLDKEDIKNGFGN